MGIIPPPVSLCTGFLKKPPPPVDYAPALQAKEEAKFQAKAAENIANPPGFDKDSVDAEMAALVDKVRRCRLTSG